MYNKTIKKSIAFITLLSIVFSCFSSLASVSIVDTDYVISIPDYLLTADDITNIDPMDQNGYYLATYRVKVTPYIYFRGSGYANGHFSFYPTFSLGDGQGNPLQSVDIKIEGETLLNDNYYCTVTWGNGVNNGSCCCFGAFNNFYVDSSQNIMPFPAFWVEVKYYLLSQNYRPQLTLKINANDSQSSIDYSNSPINDGLADVITNAIVEALGTTSDTNSVIELLYSILTEEMAQNILVSSTNSLLGTIINNLSALQGYVDGVEGILTNIYNKIALLYDNIDSIIDTISWIESTSYNFVGISSTLNGTYSKSNLSNVKDAYFKFSNPTNMLPELLYKYNIPYRLFGDFNIEIYYGGSLQWKMSFDYYFDSGHMYCPLYLYNVSTYDSTNNFVIHISKKNGNTFNCTYVSTYEHNLRYISSSDIEYFFIVQYFVMYDLLHKGETDTEAENELSLAAQQMEAAAAAMDVTKPAANTVLPESLVSGDIAAAQGTLFSWLNNSYILSILVACFTIALIGFVIYGKSG